MSITAPRVALRSYWRDAVTIAREYLAFTWAKLPVPTFIMADEFLKNVANNRVVWLWGRFGSGKTLLSLYIAQWLVENEYAAYVSSNIPVKGAVQPHEMPVPYKDSAIILDEAFLYMDNWLVAKRYLAFSRKLNHYIIMPSVWAPSPRLRTFAAMRVLNLYNMGLPLWIFHWWVDMGRFSDKGYFGLAMPHRAFGLYDTRYIPADDGGIQAAMKETMIREGFKQGRLGFEEDFLIGGQGGALDASEISDAADLIERSAVSIARNGRRKR